MRHTFIVAIALSVLLLGGVASANTAQPASKATAQVGNIAILDSTALDWTTILSNNMRTANQKDLFVDVSLECGLYTQTEVRSKGGSTDSATAEAGVDVRVLVDGQPIYPGEVTFCRRTQTLEATFGGILQQCQDLNLDGVITNEECTWDYEELNLIQDTMNANSFNFVLDDLTSGVHVVEVQAKIDTATAYQDGSAAAYATIGKGSMTVEEVRMIQGEEIQLD